ncbi:uncharacterized protein LOC118350339 isoform X4 [Canis lupus dingo]|uniref:uncharacterized protein LOC118350339 isoform X4 n=1 Tax=Canis lupus dingo TaxID=286419 RepID=UPI0020C4C2A9|nr:uncharacterized protein LOC118350339 isoform X4 [Canis lupus dingo]
MHRSTPMGTRKMQDLIRHAKITIKDSRAKIEQIVASCQACQLTNATSHGSNPGTQLQGDRPGAYWEVDFMEVKPGKYGYRYLLVFIDTFSGWTEAFPTKHETAQTVTKKLLEDILLGYGFPVRIGSDNGPGFISKIQLSEKLGQDSRKVGSPSHLSPPNYLENLQIFLKIYEFGLRFKERPAGTATVRRIPASIRCHQQLTTYQLQDKANNLPFGEHGELQSVLSAESSGPSGNAQFWSTAWFSPRLFPAFLPAALKPQQYRSPLSII